MKIIVVGGNAAGMSFAAKYKRNNPNQEIIVFEKRDYVSFGSCGLPYFVGGFFDDENEMFARSVDQIIDSGIDLRINTEIKDYDFDNKLVFDNEGISYNYDKLIISTGASPIIYNFGDFDKTRFQSLTTFEDGLNAKNNLATLDVDHVTIIGAGFIGLEIAEAMLKLGKEITIVEASNSILSNQLDQDIANIGIERINQTNIDLQLDTRVKKIIDSENGYVINTSKGSFNTNYVFNCVGFSPNTSGINLSKLANGAIIVDENLQTSTSDVYAIGDCATNYNLILNKQVYTPLATVANKYGRALADILSGIDVPLGGMISTSCLKLIDLELASTGITIKQAKEANLDFKVKVISDKNHTSYYPGQASITAQIIYDPSTLYILGCQMIGNSGVVGRVDVVALAITKKIKTSELGYIDFAYSPPFARTWDFLNILGNVCK